jgi:hypothetical protein
MQCDAGKRALLTAINVVALPLIFPFLPLLLLSCTLLQLPCRCCSLPSL